MSTRGFACLAAPGPWPGAAPHRALAAWAALVWLFLTASPVTAHGVEMTSGTGQACWVRAEYAGGEPMAFAKMKIINPQGQTHQVGHADGQGRFAWLPDQSGNWGAVAEDGMGHRGEITLEAGPDPATPPAPEGLGLGAVPLWARALWGICLILGVAGALFYWKAARPRRRGTGR
ncbi:MAG: hypothetical protein HY794_14235 [Desulfarculus sp.]|nr:hypothetical protein [Desulfarculus sp.]